VARAENTGQAFSDGKRTVPDRGREPVLVEPVQATVTVAMPASAVVYPLDPTGKRREPVAAAFEQGTLRLDLEGVRSPWCEVVVGP
jgi:hypothetical protein